MRDSPFLPEDDPVIDAAKLYAMEYAAASGEVWIAYRVQDLILVRPMSKPAPLGAVEIGRAGVENNGIPFWSTLQ